ncbi:uncharacterized protein LOC121740051 [Aricia agestis]|uniref:uncharacterized protein LOC121740051 n=1 Tax=Aricia agestis TaxID=91739 RepID=UPI001C209DE1|nr:uncharacterized protein LOC121740051 [Aricia agestis]
MRGRAGVLVLAAWTCIIHAEPHAPRKISNSKKENIQQIASCVESLGVSKCVGAYGLWRADKALGHSDTNLFFPWAEYSNLTNEDLYSRLCDGTERLLQRRSLSMNITDDYTLQLGVTRNGSINIDVNAANDPSSGRGSMKKMHKMISKVLPLLVIPGLIMSAILPFFLPSLKMMTMAAGMLNNMALSGAVFTLLRNNVFDEHNRKRIIYINNGYDKHKYDQPHTHEIIEDPYDSKFNGLETHDFRDYHLYEVNNPLFGSHSQIDTQWLKIPEEKVKNVQILNESIEREWTKSKNVRSKAPKDTKTKIKQ